MCKGSTIRLPSHARYLPGCEGNELAPAGGLGGCVDRFTGQTGGTVHAHGKQQAHTRSSAVDGRRRPPVTSTALDSRMYLGRTGHPGARTTKKMCDAGSCAHAPTNRRRVCRSGDTCASRSAPAEVRLRHTTGASSARMNLGGKAMTRSSCRAFRGRGKSEPLMLRRAEEGWWGPSSRGRSGGVGGLPDSGRGAGIPIQYIRAAAGFRCSRRGGICAVCPTDAMPGDERIPHVARRRVLPPHGALRPHYYDPLDLMVDMPFLRCRGGRLGLPLLCEPVRWGRTCSACVRRRACRLFVVRCARVIIAILTQLNR
jgi:hypothetical protein